MSKTIVVTEDVHSRVRQLARFSGCDEGEVVRRLLESLENANVDDESTPTARTRTASDTSDTSDAADLGGRYLPGRAPRERGAKIRIGSEIFRVDSVRDMFETVLRFLTKTGNSDALRSVLPFKTSSQRYLIALKPVHPNGNSFFVPVHQGSLYMEAHKSYKTAVADLHDFLGQLKVPFEYISG